MHTRVFFVLSSALTLLATSAFATPPLRTPWPCDTTFRITQGHNTGSHTGKGAWAWDIGIPVGGEVVAPADGVVRRVRMDSTVGGCSSTYANDANYVVVDFGDGTEALFLHLQAGSTNLMPGDRVVAGQPVGRIGLTGWVCGAHLHFQIQETCDSWWCQSIPAQFDMFGDPQSGSITSDNCGPPPECGAVASRADSVVVDEETVGCFFRHTQYWWSADGDTGHDGHHYFTYATDAAERETYGVWTFDVGEAGLYRVEAFIPEQEADSTSASYQIYDGSETFTSGLIDQSVQKGWIELGTFEFPVAEDLTVTLGDNTGEVVDARVKLAYDAIRVVPVEPMSSAPIDDTPEDDTPGEVDEVGPGDLDSPGGVDFSGSAQPDTTGAEAAPNSGSVTMESGCSTAGSNPVGLGCAFLLMVFAGCRRRRR
jgi:hypothetical protein